MEQKEVVDKSQVFESSITSRAEESSDDEEYLIQEGGEGVEVEAELEVEAEDRWKELGVSEVLEEEAEAELKVGVPKVQQETT